MTQYKHNTWRNSGRTILGFEKNSFLQYVVCNLKTDKEKKKKKKKKKNKKKENFLFCQRICQPDNPSYYLSLF